MIRYQKILPLLTGLLILFASIRCWAGSEIDSLLQSKQPPPGVVFEVAEDDEDALTTLIPRIAGYIGQLRARFPGIDLVIVSHGREQFLLQSKYSAENTDLHQAVKTMHDEQDINVHVCGTHAGWYGVNEEDFPEYVDVARAAPIQIDQYRELDYEVIRIE